MLRAFGAFFLMFSLLSLVVHLNGMVPVFGVGALALFAVDLLLAHATTVPRSSKMPRQTLLFR